MHLCGVFHGGFGALLQKSLDCTFVGEYTVIEIVEHVPLGIHQVTAEKQPLLLIDKFHKVAVFWATPGPPKPLPTWLNVCQRCHYALIISENPLNVHHTEFIVVDVELMNCLDGPQLCHTLVFAVF